MESSVTFIYTDASFDKKHSMAVIGFAKFESHQDHQSTGLSDMELQFEVISEKNNIRAELRAAIQALKSCPKNAKVILYSDCHSVTQLFQRREKLEKQNFISRSSGLKLSNADLYQAFYLTADQLDLEIFWVKGHSSNKNSDFIESNFSYLDKQVRKKLRSEVLMFIENPKFGN